MRKLLFGLVFALFFVVPFSARAGFIVEGSLGKGLSVRPEVRAQPVNLMVAPGLTFVSMLRLQLGLVADLPDVEMSKFDLGVRPMLTVSPPLLPLYGRAVFAMNNLLNKESRTIAYGAALGFSLSLAGIGVFAEAGLLPRRYMERMQWVIEGRAGASIGF
jgi:hypothetical protein